MAVVQIGGGVCLGHLHPGAATTTRTRIGNDCRLEHAATRMILPSLTLLLQDAVREFQAAENKRRAEQRDPKDPNVGRPVNGHG